LGTDPGNESAKAIEVLSNRLSKPLVTIANALIMGNDLALDIFVSPSLHCSTKKSAAN